jgi:tRNA A37 threonylcarbamoyltransferase TsaD
MEAQLYPHLHLLVSGGNSQIIYLQSWTDFQVIGKTLDDAAGECFDKTARMLGLPYPGGVYLSKIAGLADKNYLKFPVGMKDSKEYNFSFSGLKTAVRYYLEKLELGNGERFELEKKLSVEEIEFLTSHSLEEILRYAVVDKSNICVETSLSRHDTTQTAEATSTSPFLTPTADFNYEKLATIKTVCITVQSVIVEALLNKIDLAYKNLEVASIGLSGGVSANPLLRLKLEQKYTEKLLLAPKPLTGDNAVMIALAGILDWKHKTTN